MKELIELTNTENFLSQGFIYLKQLNFDAEKSIIELRITLIDESEKESHWIIAAENILSFKNLHFGNLMPFLKINIYDNHPLILIIQGSEFGCEVHGIPNNKFEFIGKFHQMLENEVGFWKNIQDFFWNTQNLFTQREIPEKWRGVVNNAERIEYLNLPKILFEPFKKLCEEENLTLEIKSEILNEEKNMKILIFGNEVVSPDNFNLNQPYIIAENFNAEKLSF
ncbi:hypothetical protein IX39_12220 [Chryseobacterium formosense]|uniref:Uncharacterized protein n=1 Tax=Chryseobacterium formosense TaxID=236814 RepID=A0A085ZA73_9FLAO|nr:hypothetical protein [Chryseobacterium formosense]KFF01337.1 hypothetical protein IX39_12220 [Chryseobacterium formosense]SFT45821.1 hypothetical protein SAMN05421857_1132 [Chryseobacterium formosense]